jgi:glycosyltransferase involved in cell wall biosynthesis
MERVLHVYPEMKSAGTEAVIMNLYRNIDREKVQFDLLVMCEGESDGKFRALGSTVHYLPKTKNYKRELVAFFKAHPEYKTVHTHTHKEMGTVLAAAKRAGVPTRIAHSHNSRSDLPKVMKLYKLVTGWEMESSATHFLACSREAAEWLFPRKHKRAVVWNNAIDLDSFRFNHADREKYRSKLGIPTDAKVIAHVGRFADQKNHRFLIRILNRLTEEDESVYAILVGGGPLFDEIRAEAKSDRILFLGQRSDVPALLCAADVFPFPSNYEGLGIVAVEAQASGLFCLSSLGVPAAADVGTGLFERLALTEGEDVWCERIKRALCESDPEKRAELSEMAFDTDYNIHNVAAMAEEFYLSQR